jgi:hypothetical protein
MKRLAAIVVATAAAAAVAAAITLPAGADERATADAKFVGCLRAQGLDTPADASGDAIKAWIVARGDDAAVKRAVKTCSPRGPAPELLVACLRDHGLDAPSAIDELKPWIARQFGTNAGKAALRACGVDVAPMEKAVDEGRRFTACLRAHGADVPAGAEGLALKTWLGDHEQEPAVQDAMKLCSGDVKNEVKPAGPCGGKGEPASNADPKEEATVTPEQ